MGKPWAPLHNDLNLFHFVEGPNNLARLAVERSISPTEVLTGYGLGALNAQSGFAKYCIARALEQMRDGKEPRHLVRLQWVETFALRNGRELLFNEHGPLVADALLLPFGDATPEEGVTDKFLAILLRLFGIRDCSRRSGSEWLRLLQLSAVIDQTVSQTVPRSRGSDRPLRMWNHRGAFWGAVYDRGSSPTHGSSLGRLEQLQHAVPSARKSPLQPLTPDRSKRGTQSFCCVLVVASLRNGATTAAASSGTTLKRAELPSSIQVHIMLPHFGLQMESLLASPTQCLQLPTAVPTLMHGSPRSQEATSDDRRSHRSKPVSGELMALTYSCSLLPDGVRIEAKRRRLLKSVEVAVSDWANESGGSGVAARVLMAAIESQDARADEKSVPLSHAYAAKIPASIANQLNMPALSLLSVTLTFDGRVDTPDGRIRARWFDEQTRSVTPKRIGAFVVVGARPRACRPPCSNFWRRLTVLTTASVVTSRSASRNGNRFRSRCGVTGSEVKADGFLGSLTIYQAGSFALDTRETANGLDLVPVLMGAARPVPGR
jgi:hypothetical protein